MTDPLLPETTPDKNRVPIEMVALLIVLIGAALVVWGAWSFDWRAGVVTLGALIGAAGIALGSEGV